MDCIVDAGVIFQSVRGKSARDCAIAAIVAAGERVQFPVTVIDPPTGSVSQFFLEERKQPTIDQTVAETLEARRRA